MSSPNSIGFIGLGVMGYPMCVSLFSSLANSQSLYIYDISTEVLDKFQSETSRTRVHICRSSKEVAEKSSMVFTMVPEGSHLRAVYLEPGNGVINTDLNSKILVDCSTIDTETSNVVRQKVISQFPTAAFYDAPVSGGSLGAAKASLTFMLGASETDPNSSLLHQILGTMGKSIFPCGGPSLGLTAKLCNNYCSGLIAIATSEAMNIGIKSGIDPRVLATIFSTSTAQSTISDTWNPVPGVCPSAPSSHDYQGGFKVQLMKKDFGLAVEAAERLGVNLVLGDAGLETYQAASEDPSCRDRDSRVVFRYLGGDENWAAKFEK